MKKPRIREKQFVQDYVAVVPLEHKVILFPEPLLMSITPYDLIFLIQIPINEEPPLVLNRLKTSPDWYGSVGWALSHKPKGHQFDSQSGYMLGLQARSQAGGVQEAANLI